MQPDPASVKKTPQQLHNRQLWLQVLLPLGVFLAIAITLGVLSALNAGSSPEVNQVWSSISIILLMLPYFLIGALLLVLLVLTIYLLTRAPHGITQNMGIIAYYINKLKHTNQSVNQKAAQPFISVRAARAGAARLIQLLNPKYSASRRDDDSKT